MPQILLQPNPDHASLEELNRAMVHASEVTHLRLFAIVLLLMGSERAKVLEVIKKSDDTLRLWVRRYNQAGIDGLIDKRCGPPKKISGEIAKQLCRQIEQPEKAGRTFWTVRAFHGHLRETFQLDCGYETVRRFFHDQGYRLKTPQPWPVRQEEGSYPQRRSQYLSDLEQWQNDPDVDLWFADETGIEAEPRPYRRWAQKGSKPRVAKNGDHLRLNVIGIVNPRSGEFFAIETSHCDREMFQVFLDETAKCVQPKRKRNILIVDNASWHKSKTIDWHNFEVQYLPPYSPDLNPIEWLWLIIKKEYFNNYHCKTLEKLIQRTDQALLNLMQKPEQVAQSTNSILKV